MRKIYRLLKERGHEITLDWTLHKPVKPYEQNQEATRQYAIEDIEGVKSCDVFILLNDARGAGMYVELGAAVTP